MSVLLTGCPDELIDTTGPLTLPTDDVRESPFTDMRPNFDSGDLRPENCGNNQLDEGEECDDGNSVDNDECHNNCTINQCVDSDLDGVCNQDDLCEGFDDNLDSDFDGLPDDCDECDDLVGDDDLDGISNDCDLCPTDNPDDTDLDGVCDSEDLCADFDDAIDEDLDGVPDLCDICIGDDTIDSDSDGVPDDCDLCEGFDDAPDDDLDGVPNACDACVGGDDFRDLNEDGTPDFCDCDFILIGCGANARCEESPTGAFCVCNPGFSGDGATCVDINECLWANGGCDLLTTCMNTEGARVCGPCPIGYTGDGESGCLLSACAIDNGGCDPLVTCTDTDTGPVCGPCPEGWEGDGISGCLRDVNECETGEADCHLQATCTDTPGGWECECNSGFTGNGVACVSDIAGGTALILATADPPRDMLGVGAAEALELNVQLATSGSAFNSLYDADDFDIIILDLANTEITQTRSRIEDWIGREGGLIISWGGLQDDAEMLEMLEVEATSFDDGGRAINPVAGAEFDVFEGVPTPLLGDDLMYDPNGQLLDLVGSGVVLARFDEAATPNAAIVATVGGRHIVNGFFFWDYGLTDADADTLPDIQEIVQNEIRYLWVNAVDVGEAVSFPTESDELSGFAGTCNMWSEGNYHEGRREIEMASFGSAEIHLALMTNGLTCDSQDVRLDINGVTVGEFTILPGQSVVEEVFEFGAVAGPDVTFRYETTRTVGAGCGSTCYDLIESSIDISP